MSDQFKAVIETLQGEVQEKEKEVVDLKKMINSLCPKAKLPIIYPDIELQSFQSVGQFRNDHFYGQPLASAVREILSARKTAGQGAASVNDIYTVLVGGGFKFETSNEDNAKRGLRISLSKNNITFHKLPNGNWGLREWYPNIKEAKEKEDDADDASAPAARDPLGKDGEDGVMFSNKKATS
ncbi:MAG: hypothetical protein JWN51_2372 [Phycisphaerales bacterium]|nr:hypothetical protein [Phycisphaerales bacterium]